ncbi:C-X-C motif chemokine 2-like [Stegastes partitus]|uniref:C-X-C motif chemokine 2-like n=1 Tax=Stegastes partitus TaxID=144197 RepID=A0A9Y4K8T3_9TELE|nr:PREDICTED: C-X-C motif chemokine 2-like [Stegastes partitus]
MMGTATIQCIILLACIAICSSVPVTRCLCNKPIQAVNSSLIAQVTPYEPRAYCNKQEVIVTLKNGTTKCLDPGSAFTKKLLQVRQQNMARANKVNVISPAAKKTTPASATVSGTESATELMESATASLTESATESATALPTSS